MTIYVALCCSASMLDVVTRTSVTQPSRLPNRNECLHLVDMAR